VRVKVVKNKVWHGHHHHHHHLITTSSILLFSILLHYSNIISIYVINKC
jgi:hypothetical protein